MATFMRTENLMAKIRLCVAFALSYLLMASTVFGQHGIEEKIFEVWRKREADTAKLSLELNLETKTQTGFFFDPPKPSTGAPPASIEVDTTLVRYKVVIDSPIRLRIESQGPRPQVEFLRNTHMKQIEAQDEDGATSLRTTAAFGEFEEMSIVSVYPKDGFQADGKDYDLLPLYLVYRPSDQQVRSQHDLAKFIFAREDKIGEKKVIVLDFEQAGVRQECWVETSGNYLPLRYRQFQLNLAKTDWVPFIEMDLKFGQPAKGGIPKLSSWHTVYTNLQARAGTRQSEMRGNIIDLQFPESIAKSNFDFELPSVYVMCDRTSPFGKDHLQLKNGEKVPITYPPNETGTQTINRLLKSAKK